MSMEEFHSAHPKRPQEGCVAIDWSRSVGRSSSVRVREHTCPCMPTSYELCAVGGLAHIRRTERTLNGDRVSESPWLRTTAVRELWADLLDGRAR